MSNSLSQVLNKRIPNPISDAQSVLFSDITSLDDLYIHLARQQLTPDANSGKQRFYAVVTNIIDNPGIQTDPFLSKQYEIARTNGISDKEASSPKAVFLHVPALHTFYYEAYDNEITKGNKATEEKKVTQFDLQKLVAFTTKSLAIRNVVTITFENLKDYTGPIILDENSDKNNLLQQDREKFRSSKELFQNILQCKILAADEAEGYAAFSNTAVKQKPRRGYWSFYLDFINQIKTENLVNKIIVSNTTDELNKLGIGGDNSVIQKANALELFKGVSFTLKANQEVFNYINSQQSLSNSEGLTPKIELDSQLSTETAISLTVTSPDSLKNKIINIIESIVGGYYGFTWETKGGNYFIDPFPDEPIIDAINKSKALDGLSTQNPESAQITVTESPVEGVPLTDAQKNQAVPTTKIKENTPKCKDQTAINNEIYIKAENSANSSFNSDNKRIKKVNQKKNLSEWHSSIKSILLFDYKEASKKGLPKTAEFIYENGQPEIISPIEEVEKKPPEQQSKGKKPEPKKDSKKPKSTNGGKIEKNNEQLSNFVTAFTKFIATNEGIDQNRVFLVPLSVFRPFKEIKLGSGQDQNSRHFFNRAIDFVVYLAPNGYKTNSTQLPSEGTFEIPNYIVYCYLLKFISLQPYFAQCSIGLLEKGNPRKTGYVHYEWMGGLEGDQTKLVKLNRRWVSDGGAENSLYKKAFGQLDQNKDSIIKNWVLAEVEAKLGILPTKLENLL